MYSDIPLLLSLLFIVGGFVALAWSSDVFVDGAAALARAVGISPFIIGMVIIGFGTSAPELCVSAMAGISNHASISLGNAYGSCIFNIAVILGAGALILPLAVKPSITFGAAPVLTLISLFSMWVLKDGYCTRTEALSLLGAFLVILPLYCWYDQRGKKDEAQAVDAADEKVSIFMAVVKLVLGIAVLIGSSHILVWGAVDFAKFLNVSDLVIGLTIIAIGTSLPELASAIASARKGEHEFVLGNIIGSNLFNSLAVVGLATSISPIHPSADGAPGFSTYVLSRDLPMMAILSFSILIFGINWKHPTKAGVITRGKAFVWLSVFVAYSILIFLEEIHG